MLFVGGAGPQVQHDSVRPCGQACTYARLWDSYICFILLDEFKAYTCEIHIKDLRPMCKTRIHVKRVAKIKNLFARDLCFSFILHFP